MTRIRILGLLAAFTLVAPAGLVASELAILETPAGRIVFRLLPEKAPATVENFKKLARQGFYDGTTFHRVIPDYIIQGGSPTSKDDDLKNDNFGGPGYTVDPEFNDVPHARGVVSMARNTEDPKSAGSQFFIVLGRAPILDQIQFTVFGVVTEGMDVADKVASAPRDEDNFDRPRDPIAVRRVRIVAEEVPAAAVVASASAAPAPSPAEAAAAVNPGGAQGPIARVRVVSSTVNVREGPSTAAAVIERVKAGKVFPMKSRAGEWIAVVLANGAVGYVREDMVVEVQP